MPKEYERYSWDEYRSWPEEERWELIDGVAYDLSPAPTVVQPDVVPSNKVVQACVKGMCSLILGFPESYYLI